MFRVCAYKSLLKFMFRTLFGAFYLFIWIPAALCKRLHLPLLGNVVVFYFKTQERWHLFKWEPCGDAMWTSAVQMGVKQAAWPYTSASDWCSAKFSLQQKVKLLGSNVAAVKSCCCGCCCRCCWRTQTPLPMFTGTGCGFLIWSWISITHTHALTQTHTVPSLKKLG